MTWWNADPLSPLLRPVRGAQAGNHPAGRRCPIDGTPLRVGWGACQSVACIGRRYAGHAEGCPLAGAPSRRVDAVYCSTRCRVTADRRRRAVTAAGSPKRIGPGDADTAVAIARAVTAARGHADA